MVNLLKTADATTNLNLILPKGQTVQRLELGGGKLLLLLVVPVDDGDESEDDAEKPWDDGVTGRGHVAGKTDPSEQVCEQDDLTVEAKKGEEWLLDWKIKGTYLLSTSYTKTLPPSRSLGTPNKIQKFGCDLLAFST